VILTSIVNQSVREHSFLQPAPIGGRSRRYQPACMRVARVFPALVTRPEWPSRLSPATTSGQAPASAWPVDHGALALPRPLARVPRRRSAAQDDRSAAPTATDDVCQSNACHRNNRAYAAEGSSQPVGALYHLHRLAGARVWVPDDADEAMRSRLPRLRQARPRGSPAIPSTSIRSAFAISRPTACHASLKA
jgi:hypothetical protein